MSLLFYYSLCFCLKANVANEAIEAISYSIGSLYGSTCDGFLFSKLGFCCSSFCPTSARAGAQKRGGGTQLLSLDFRDAEGRYLAEPADSMTAERFYQRRWRKVNLVERATGQPNRWVIGGPAQQISADFRGDAG